MIRRNTVQRELVLNAVRSLKNHATADEIYSLIIKNHPTIGKGTVYRNLNILAEEGEIRKVEIPGGPDCFDHNCTQHYHVRCINCGRVFDVDMDIVDLDNNIHGTNGIRLLAYDILFKGICAKCQKNNHVED